MFLAMGMNADGTSGLLMADALDRARAIKGQEAQERGVQKGLLATDGINYLQIGSAGHRSQPSRARTSDAKSVPRHKAAGRSEGKRSAPMPSLPPIKD
jgi:hypothetical protein